MGRIIYLEGSRAVGKTTLLKKLKQKFPNLVIIDGFARKDFSFDLKQLDDFILNEKLYLACDIAEYNELRNNNRTVIWVKGPYTDVYFTRTFPKTINKDWNISTLLKKELELIENCTPDEIVYLDASEKTILDRYSKDSNKRATMTEWMKWLPEFRNHYLNKRCAKIIKTDNLSPEEVMLEFERRFLKNNIGISSKLIERNHLSFVDIKKIGYSFIDYNIERTFSEEKMNNDFYSICNSGLYINQAHLPYVSTPGILNTKEKYDEYISSCQNTLEFCVKKNIPYAVLHPLTFEKWMTNFGLNSRYEANIFYINKLLTTIKNTKCILAIENLPCLEFSSPTEFMKLFSDLNSSNIGFCFDSGHAAINNFSYKDFSCILDKKICVFHLNSNDGKNDSHLSIGTGKVNVEELKKSIVLYDGLYLCSEIKLPANMNKDLLEKELENEFKILEGIYNDSIDFRK